MDAVVPAFDVGVLYGYVISVGHVESGACSGALKQVAVSVDFYVVSLYNDGFVDVVCEGVGVSVALNGRCWGID